jgi:dTDP-glucose 4,6-dehydratase
MDLPVLITGAGGFIGSHLAEACVERGMRVKAFVHYNSSSRYGWLDHSGHAKEMEIIAGDIRDFDSVTRALKGCGSVFHLAALIGIPYSYVSPLAYIRTNVEGTYNVVEAARTVGLERVLVTSTSETYGTAQYVPIDESHPVIGQSPYAASKIGADELALSYYRSFGLPVSLVRPFNTYGPRQSSRAFIPTVVSQILAGHKRLMVGNLEPTRDLTFVKDTVQGFLAIAAAEEFIGSVTNIGSGQEISMRQLLEKIIRLTGADIEWEEEPVRTRPSRSEVAQLRCDNSRITESSDWMPTVDLNSGLRSTIDWIGRNLEIYNPDAYGV